MVFIGAVITQKYLEQIEFIMKNKTENRIPVVAVGAVIVLDNRILLVKRKYPPAKGLWAIPGGRIKWGESLQQAAEREIFEETSINIKAGDVVYVFDYIQNENNKEFHFVIIDLDAEYISGRPIAGDDAEEVRWISMDHISKLKIAESTLKFLKQKFSL